MEYEQLRQFADTWGLVLLVVAFVGIVVFVFRRRAKKKHEEAARIPLKRD